ALVVTEGIICGDLTELEISMGNQPISFRQR
ncbi:MAG: hypothetical protein ACI9KM_002945, partial [Rubritalea sp.]